MEVIILISSEHFERLPKINLRFQMKEEIPNLSIFQVRIMMIIMCMV